MEAPAAATFLHLATDPKLGPGKERLSLNVLPSLEIARPTRVLEHVPPPPPPPPTFNVAWNTCEGNSYTRLRLLHNIEIRVAGGSRLDLSTTRLPQRLKLSLIVI